MARVEFSREEFSRISVTLFPILLGDLPTSKPSVEVLLHLAQYGHFLLMFGYHLKSFHLKRQEDGHLLGGESATGELVEVLTWVDLPVHAVEVFGS